VKKGSVIDRGDATVVLDERSVGRRLSDFDFRRPSQLGRDVLRVLELAHETFARRLSSGWGSELRSIVQVDPLGVDQMAYDDHIRAMPNPNVVFVVAVPPLPGAVIVDCNVQLALQMVERLLGAAPRVDVAPPRRPSEVEADLIRFLAQQVVGALRDTLGPLVDVEPELELIEYNPQLVQVAAPSDTSLLLSYRIDVSQGLDAHGFLTVAYPAPTLTPLLVELGARRQGDERDERVEAAARGMVEAALVEVPVTLSVRLNPSPVAAADLASLQVGDVLRLDHRVDAPARGVVGDHDAFLAHLGRRGRRHAVQVKEWLTRRPELPVEIARVADDPADEWERRDEETAP
jgi:flagellar motor switch protein FliM